MPSQLTISQTHAMSEARINLWKSSSPTSTAQSRANQTYCPRTIPTQVLSISKDNLCQRVIIPIANVFLLVLQWKLLHFSLCPMPLTLSFYTTENA